HLYGAMIVKLDLASFPHLLVRPTGDHLLVPTLTSNWPPRAVTVKDGPGAHRAADLSLTVTSTGGRLERSGARHSAADDSSEGSSP
ncbi:hypothetical protein, partial [Mesorhizobium sp.]|uniref:hypothetical protein n=1 Tax=Mesorhizobium sp. TaxID=1871066 RepID=UPI00257E4EA7